MILRGPNIRPIKTHIFYSFLIEWILEHQVKQKQFKSVSLLDYKMDYVMKSDNYSTFCL